MRVLVVDDSRAIRMRVAHELRKIDSISDVGEADGAERAIEMLGGDPVDLIVCDWDMEGMSGLELLQALRAAGWTTPFGFLTAEQGAYVAAEAFANGAAFVVGKPFASEDFSTRVLAALSGATVEDLAVLPSALDRKSELREVLEALVHRSVEVEAAKSAPTRQVPRWTASYVDENGNALGSYILETSLASALSAALLAMPPALALEWANSNALPDALAESFHEVMSVLARTVCATSSRCVVHEVSGYAPGEQLQDIDRVRGAALQECMKVSVDRYGGGLLCLVLYVEQP